MKTFLPLTERVRTEMEESYPVLVQLRDSLLDAVMGRHSLGAEEEEMVAEKKRLVYQVFRKTESFMSSELSKLRSRPKRATKFCLYTKRVITMLKVALDSISDHDQVEAYPTLALICTHFINIMLPSSMTESNLPKFLASNLYSFMKAVFSMDLEYVLDVLICSNIFEEAESQKAVGYHVLREATYDHYLYTYNTSVFAKYLTVLAFLKQSCSLEWGVCDGIVKELEGYRALVPATVRSHLEEQYGIKFSKHKKVAMGWAEVLDYIKARKVASVTRRNRLVVVSSKRKHKKGKQEQFSEKGVPTRSGQDSEDIDNAISLGKKTKTKGSEDMPLFFLDRRGNEDNEVTSSGFIVSLNSNEQESIDHESVFGYSLLPPWEGNNAEDELSENVESRELNRSTSPTSTVFNALSPRPADEDPCQDDDGDDGKESGSERDHKHIKKNNKSGTSRRGKSEPETERQGTDRKNSKMNMSIDSDTDEDQIKRPASKRQKAQLLKDYSDDDSDLEVVFEELVPPKVHSTEEGVFSDGEGSRDEAPSESGESNLPDLSPQDLGIRRLEFDEQVDETEAVDDHQALQRKGDTAGADKKMGPKESIEAENADSDSSGDESLPSITASTSRKSLSKHKGVPSENPNKSSASSSGSRSSRWTQKKQSSKGGESNAASSPTTPDKLRPGSGSRSSSSTSPGPRKTKTTPKADKLMPEDQRSSASEEATTIKVGGTVGSPLRSLRARKPKEVSEKAVTRTPSSRRVTAQLKTSKVVLPRRARSKNITSSSGEVELRSPTRQSVEIVELDTEEKKENDEPPTSSPSKKGRRRASDDIELLSAADSSIPQPKRGRGRPPKNTFIPATSPRRTRATRARTSNK